MYCGVDPFEGLGEVGVLAKVGEEDFYSITKTEIPLRMSGAEQRANAVPGLLQLRNHAFAEEAICSGYKDLHAVLAARPPTAASKSKTRGLVPSISTAGIGASAPIPRALYARSSRAQEPA